jgi:hypothetical protein
MKTTNYTKMIDEITKCIMCKSKIEKDYFLCIKCNSINSNHYKKLYLQYYFFHKFENSDF